MTTINRNDSDSSPTIDQAALSRRNMVTKLFGATVGVTALAGCPDAKTDGDIINTVQAATLTSYTSVDTVAELRALSTTAAASAQVVSVLGYHERGDGGGGLFRWDASATADDDLGTVLTPSSSPAAGRWRRLGGGPLSVRWFGAKGNHVHDDHSAIQSAINAALRQGPIQARVVFFPPGAYVVTKELVLVPTGLTGGVSVGTELALVGVTPESSGILYMPQTASPPISAADAAKVPSVLNMVGHHVSTIQNLRITSEWTTMPPKTVMLMGRSGAGSAGAHKVINCIIEGKCTEAVLYCIASEENTLQNTRITLNAGAGSTGRYALYAAQQDFLNVWPGRLTGSTVLGIWASHCRFMNYTGSTDPNSAVVCIEGGASTGDMAFRDCYFAAACVSGILLLAHTNELEPFPGGPNPPPHAFGTLFGPLVFDGIRVESGSASYAYGVHVKRSPTIPASVTGPAAAARIKITNCNFPDGSYFIRDFRLRGLPHPNPPLHVWLYGLVATDLQHHLQPRRERKREPHPCPG